MDSQGRLAGMIRTEVRSRIIAREQALLNRLIQKYRGDQLTGDEARAGIAAIAEIRSFMLDLDREVRRGQEAEDSGPALRTHQEAV